MGYLTPHSIPDTRDRGSQREKAISSGTQLNGRKKHQKNLLKTGEKPRMTYRSTLVWLGGEAFEGGPAPLRGSATGSALSTTTSAGND